MGALEIFFHLACSKQCFFQAECKFVPAGLPHQLRQIRLHPRVRRGNEEDPKPSLHVGRIKQQGSGSAKRCQTPLWVGCLGTREVLVWFGSS